MIDGGGMIEAERLEGKMVTEHATVSYGHTHTHTNTQCTNAEGTRMSIIWLGAMSQL